MSMAVLIQGSTPLAGWLAAKLHPGYRVTWLADETIQARIQAKGVQIEGRIVSDLNIITALKDIGKPDVILLAMPGWALANAVLRLRNHIALDESPPVMVSMQIGVGGLQRVESVFGTDHTLTAVPTRKFRFAIDARGETLYELILPDDFGGVAVQSNHPYTQMILDLMSEAGFTAKPGRRDSILWSSVFWGIQGNALSAILDIAPEQIYNDPNLFEIEHQQLVEALGIIRKLNVPLITLPDVNVPLMARQTEWIPRSLLSYFLKDCLRPPLLQDELRGQNGRSEAAYLNGAVAVHADQMDLRTPVNHALALITTDIAEGRVLWSQYKDNPEMLHVTLRLAR